MIRINPVETDQTAEEQRRVCEEIVGGPAAV